VKEIFQSIAPKSKTARPAATGSAKEGSGHYVKMVHNGIEYGDMQLICEAYQLLRDGLGVTADELHDIFAEWNKTRARQLSDRNQRRNLSPRRTKTARRWSIRSSTRRAKRAPASGPASARSTSACRSR
jgi:3-hydroxyisobutyrate dehydrogenase-like beta-hydroxyacid dehydrogenase